VSKAEWIALPRCSGAWLSRDRTSYLTCKSYVEQRVSTRQPIAKTLIGQTVPETWEAQCQVMDDGVVKTAKWLGNMTSASEGFCMVQGYACHSQPVP